jgi:hypothetical protein
MTKTEKEEMIDCLETIISQCERTIRRLQRPTTEEKPKKRRKPTK